METDALSTLQLNIVHDTKSVVDNIDKLVSKLYDLRRACEGGAGLKSVSDALKDIKTDMSSINRSKGIENLAKQASNVSSGMRKAKESVQEMCTALVVYNNIIDRMKKNGDPNWIPGAGTAVSTVPNWGGSTTIQQYTTLADQFREFRNTAPNWTYGTGVGSIVPNGFWDRDLSDPNIIDGTAIEIDPDTIKVVSGLKEETKDLAKATAETTDAFNKEGEATSNASKGMKKISEETKKAKDTSHKATSSIGKLVKAIGRVAFYRAIRTAIKEVTEAFKEGIDNLYQWSKLNDREFSNSMDTISTATHYIRNSLGAMLAPVINALAPVVDMIADKFVNLLNIVNQFLARITGADHWTRALKKQKEYAESAKGTAKALSAILMGFDEINNITTPSSGSPGDAEDYNDLFEKMDEFDPRVKKISDLFKKILGGINTVYNKAKPWIDKILNSLKDIAEIVLDWINGGAEQLGNIWDGVLDSIDGSLQTVYGVVEMIAGFLSGDTTRIITGLIDVVGGTCKSTVSLALTAFSVIVGVLGTFASVIVELIEKPIAAMATWIGEKLKGLAKETGWEWADRWGDAFLSVSNNVDAWSENVKDRTREFQDKIEYTRKNICNGIDETTKYWKNKAKEWGEAGANGGANYWSAFKSAAVTASANNPITVSTPSGSVSVVRAADIHSKISFNANGGYVGQGSLFVAGEVPGQAEMVGNINGRTGVASGKEITGIADAVYATGDENSRLLREIYNALLTKNLTIAPSAGLGRVVAQSSKMYQAVTG